MRPTSCERDLHKRFVKTKLKAHWININDKIRVGDTKYIVEGLIPEDEHGVIGFRLVNSKNMTDGLLLDVHKNTKLMIIMKVVN